MRTCYRRSYRSVLVQSPADMPDSSQLQETACSRPISRSFEGSVKYAADSTNGLKSTRVSLDIDDENERL